MGLHAFTGRALTTGRAPRRRGRARRGTARAAKAAVGDTVTLDRSDGRRGLPGRGLAEAGPGDTPAGAGTPPRGSPTPRRPRSPATPAGWTPSPYWPRPGYARRRPPGAGADALAGSSADVHPGDDRGAVEDPGLGYAKETLIGIGGSFGGIATIVAIFTAAGTVALSVGQRAREFALLRAIGATPGRSAAPSPPRRCSSRRSPGRRLSARNRAGALVVRAVEGQGRDPRGGDLSVSWIPLVAAVGVGLLTALAAGYGPPAQARADQAGPGADRGVRGAAAVRRGSVRRWASPPRPAARSSPASPRTRPGRTRPTPRSASSCCFMLAVALLGPLVARLCAALFGLPLRGAGAAGALAAANSRTNARRLASAITPIVLAMAFASTLVFMHTSETGSPTNSSARASPRTTSSPTRRGMPAGRRGAGGPCARGGRGRRRAQHAVLVPVGSGGDRCARGASAQGVTGSAADLAAGAGPGRTQTARLTGSERAEIAVDSTLADLGGRRRRRPPAAPPARRHEGAAPKSWRSTAAASAWPR